MTEATLHSRRERGAAFVCQAAGIVLTQYCILLIFSPVQALQAPLPGENAFVHLNTRVAGYANRPLLCPGSHSAIPDGTYKDPSAPVSQMPQKTGLQDLTPIRGSSPAIPRPGTQ